MQYFRTRRTVRLVTGMVGTLILAMDASAFVIPIVATTRTLPSLTTRHMWWDNNELVSQSNLDHETLSETLSDSVRTLAIQERLIGWTSEDFDVFEQGHENDSPYIRVRGALLSLPGKDKMRLYRRTSDRNDEQVVAASMERKLLALRATYDVYRGDGGEKLGWIDKKVPSLTDVFEFYLENEKGPFAKPAYWLEGDFFDRRFVMKNRKSEVVAVVRKDRIIEFEAFEHYQVLVAPGMDVDLVVACACAIDEELDQEREKSRSG